MKKKKIITTTEAFAQQITISPRVVNENTKKKFEVSSIPQSPTLIEGLQNKIFLDRYAWKDETGNPLESVPDQMWTRVAKAMAAVEKTPKLKKEWEEKFFYALSDFKFLPGGRILSAAGTGYEVTYYNCFVIPSPPDSRGGIIDNLKVMTEMLSRAGGVGINLSSLRPSGARVKKVNGTSSGPVNWANLYSVACHDVIQQGGCFSADALIMTHLGLTPIMEIINEKRDYYVFTHKGYKKVTAKFDNGVKDLYEVKTEAGFSVKVTNEHRLLTVDNEGYFCLKQLKDFKAGESTVLLLGDWRKDIPCALLNSAIPTPSKFSSGRTSVKLPKTLDAKLAFLIGVYDADGSKIQDEFSLNGKGIRIAVAQNRPKDLEFLIQTIKDLFGIQPKLYKGDGAVTIVSIFSRQLNEFLTLNGLLKVSSAAVEVPRLILNSPKNVVESYIAGVFFGDGTNRGGKGGFRICTVSEKFAKRLQLLLMSLGIAAKIKPQIRTKENWSTIYNVTINGHQFMQKFCGMIKPFNEKANDNPISTRDGSFSWPFNLTARFAYLANFQRTIARTNPNTTCKAVTFLENHLAEMINPQDINDAQILSSTVSDKIVSIKYSGKENVYDLEVEDAHLLSGNGFYTSNSRRGALMLMLHDWHPDIEEFIEAKQDHTKLVGANLSVCLSDDFMKAVEEDGDWRLRFPDHKHPEYDNTWDGDLVKWEEKGYPVSDYKTIKAREIWDKICRSAWASAEPGLHFLDRSNKQSNTWYFERLCCTNPCGEQPLGPWAVCNLGSLNLSQFMKGEEMDYQALAEHTAIAVRFLDNVIDDNYYFFPENEKIQKSVRRIGLGTMGLGDALIKMKLRYGSVEALEAIEKIYKTIRDSAYSASADLALEKGSFPKFDKSKYLEGYFIKELPADIREKIAKQGIRNAVLLTQAPTGTTSLLAGVSSGIEPVFDFAMKRKDRTGESIIYHPLFKAWKDDNPDEEVPPRYFVSANDLSPDDHILVQSVVQKYTDASISKTVNAPNSHTVEEVEKLYMDAYKLGCKGITYFRDGCREGVLSHIEEKSEVTQPVVETVTNRPMILPGRTYEILTPVGKAFITINHDAEGSPREVFINVGKTGMHTGADAEAIGRLISIALRFSKLGRREVAEKITSQLRGIGGASHIGFGKERVMSLADAVAKVLAEDLAYQETSRAETIPLNLSADNDASNGVAHDHQLDILSSISSPHKTGDLCPECGNASFVFEEGCKKCHNCGYSMC